ncbi:Intermediate filament protein [Phlyctochytrium bullatum]|nr:Intermediate filament protein [Phlyctochytrium bullatum]
MAPPGSPRPHPIRARINALTAQVTAVIPPELWKFLPYIVLAIAVSPRLFVLIVLFAGGLVLGFSYGSKSTEESAKDMDDTMTTAERIDRFQEVLGPKTQLAEFIPMSPNPLHDEIPAEIDKELTRFLDLFIRDYIVSWFDPLNHSKSSEFPSAVQAALRHGFIKLGYAAANMNVVTAVVPISQSLIHHIREYRQYEQSSLPLDIYLAQNPACRFQRYRESSTTQQHLRRLSAHFALCILPRSDRGSPIVFSFVRELVATSVLASIVETYSDPDVINRAIVEYCKGLIMAEEAKALAAANGGVAPEGINGVANDGVAIAAAPGVVDNALRKDSSSSSLSSFSDLSAPKVTKSKMAASNPTADQLYLKIVEGRRLPFGTASFYCAIMCGSELLKTKKVTAEANPIWMEDFQFHWDKKAAQEVENIVIDLYDTRTFRDELVGTINIPTDSLSPNKFSKAWYPLKTNESRNTTNAGQASEVLVEIMMISTEFPEDDDSGSPIDLRHISQPTSPANATGPALTSESPEPSIKTPSAPSTAALPPPVATSHPPVPAGPTSAGSTRGNNLRRGPTSSLALLSPLSPLSPDFQPTDLTLHDVLDQSEALVEFMQYMENLGQASYVQLYLAIDTYKKAGSASDDEDAATTALEEAQSLFETFFAAGARFPVSFDDIDADLVPQVGKLVSAAGGDVHPAIVERTVFDRIQDRAEETLGGYFKGFRNSPIFNSYVQRETRRTSISGSSPSAATFAAEEAAPTLPPRAPSADPPPQPADATEAPATVPPPKPKRAHASPNGTPPQQRASTVQATLPVSPPKSVEEPSEPAPRIEEPADNPFLDGGEEADISGAAPPPMPPRPRVAGGSEAPKTSGMASLQPLNLMDADLDDISEMMIQNRLSDVGKRQGTPEEPDEVSLSGGLALSEGAGSDTESGAAPPPLPSRPTEEEEAAKRAAMEEEDRQLALQLQRLEEEEAQEAALGGRNGGRLAPPPPPARRPRAGSNSSTNSSTIFDGSSVGGEMSTVELLAAEIVKVKEQIMAVDEALDESSGAGLGGVGAAPFGNSSKVKELMDQKMKLMEKLSTLQDMVAEAEEAESGGGNGPPTISLQDVRIHVTDSNGANADPSVVRRDTDRGLIFSVEVERNDGSAGWMLTHSYTDFQLAYDRLRESFAKVGKSPFPVLSPLDKANVAASSEKRAVLAADLEKWLNIILTEPVLCGHRVMQELMLPESVKRQYEVRRFSLKQAKDAASGTNTIRRQVFDVLKSAGRVVKNAAVSTGTVVGNVGGAAINSVRRGVTPVDTNTGREISWERKLEQRKASSSPQRTVQPSGSWESSVAYSGNGTAGGPPPPPLGVARSGSIDSRSSGDSLDRGRKAPPPPPPSRPRDGAGAPPPPLPSRQAQDQRVPPPPPPRPNRSPQRGKDGTAVEKKPPLTPYEIEAILECLFGTIEEIFRLSDPNQWIRQKGLHMVKSVLRRTHGAMIAQLIQDRLEEAKSTEAVAGYIRSSVEAVWPADVAPVATSTASSPSNTPSEIKLDEAAETPPPPPPRPPAEDAQLSTPPPPAEPKPPRTEEEKNDTRIEAKKLLLRCAPLMGLDSLETVVGRYNTVAGINSVFSMLQHQELNRGLICAVLEAAIKSLLSSEL